MIERLGPKPRGLDEDLKILTQSVLTDEIDEPFRAQARLDGDVLLLNDRIHQRGLWHRHAPFLAHGG